MTDIEWQPVRGYGLCYLATVDGLIFETGKLKSGYYYFVVKRIMPESPPKLIYDSRVDVFCEKTQHPQRIREIAERWHTIKRGKR